MELFLFERCNSFRGVNLNLYMNQLAFNPGPDPERWHRGLKGLCHDLRGYEA